MSVDGLKEMIVSRYKKSTIKSSEYMATARQYLPGGDTRSAAYFKPYPFCSAYGNGCRLTDIDGNTYIDFVNNFTSLVHGHAHPEIVKAIVEQAERGTAHGTPVEQQYMLAKIICDRMSNLDQIRYCNSASEAVMYAMRTARVFTKKDAFIRIDGGYNGCTDYVEVNITPDFMAPGTPTAKIEPGITKNVLLDTYVVPFNDLEATEAILKVHADKIAGIVMEPMLGAGGLIMPKEGYLAGIRKLADQYGVLLIFDETITLRFHSGGLEAIQNVKGDIVATGKIIGGGLPVGAFGAKKEIMDMYNPEKEGAVSHSGTFSGNALTMAAGYTSMRLLNQSEIDRINSLGNRMRAGFAQAYKDVGISGTTTGFGSIVGTSFSPKPVSNAKEAVLAMLRYREAYQYLQLGMLFRGVYYVARGMFAISTAMSEKEIDFAVCAFKETLEEAKPIIESL